MKSISLCMIVKNEEDRLARCLDSVKDAVQEIVLVDTGSTDRTLEIAEAFGAKIIHFTWEGDFSSARNVGLEVAQGEYILVLDADEYVDRTETLQEDLASGADAYLLSFENQITGGRTYSHTALRLFRNSPEFRFREKIHEYIEVNSNSVQVGETLVHHDGYLKEVIISKDKNNRNLTILKHLVKKSPTGYNLYNLAREYQLAEEYNKALFYYEQAYEKSKQEPHLAQLLFGYCMTLKSAGRIDDGIGVTRAAITAFPHYTDLHYILGELYEHLGYQKDAEQCYRYCLRLGEVKQERFVYYGVSVNGAGSFLPRIKLARMRLNENKLSAALDELSPVLGNGRWFLEGLPIYLELACRARIPISDQVTLIRSLYPVKTGSDALALIRTLYVAQSSLLETFLQRYGVNLGTDVQGAAYLYNGCYEEACAIYLRENQAPLDELVALAILQENCNILEKQRERFQGSDKQWKVLLSIVSRQRDSYELSVETRKILSNAGVLLLRLGRTSSWEQIAEILKHSSSEMWVYLCELAQQWGEDSIVYRLTQSVVDINISIPEKVHLLRAKVLLTKGEQNEVWKIWNAEFSRRRTLAYETYVFYLYFFRLQKEGELTRKLAEEFARSYPLSGWAQEQAFGKGTDHQHR
ncbi:glycosyltransferase [Gorillibacterium sp. CAU 1737]|uniref:glycosyltransferase n=1 Tax=Gorillibacterium sp. CAU 1737 TaxID=3140362 RepID=UPI00326196B4